MTHDAVRRWNRKAAQRGALDGEWLSGSLSSGTYHLPSCRLPPPRKTDRLVFASETLARAAGLRPCKTCRPDRFHAVAGHGLGQFHRLTDLMASDPSKLPDIDALAAAAALPPDRLEVVLGDHAQLTASAWLNRERARFAATRLLAGSRAPSDIVEAAGFQDRASYARVFTTQMAMPPEEYAALGRRMDFRLRLPQHYRPEAVLAYQGRVADGLAERVAGRRLWKALATAEGPVLLEMELMPSWVAVKIHGPRLSRASVAKLHRDSLKILGLGMDIDDFEKAHPALVETRRGLRVPLIPSAFDALCWAIIGQQINLSFAGSLRQALILRAGDSIGDMKVHPTPAAIAALDPVELTSRRFSRSKARYLIDTAQAIAAGRLDIEQLVDGSALEAERLLTAQHGIGTWTARYVLMRTGFADAAPVGDSGLATALGRLHDLPERPDAVMTARLMARYAPWRSLASLHLWASLQTTAG
ncbi:Ada metal-binding domain-containing protein [Frateuria aurantia]